jgi:hypothetical protein
MIDDWSSIITLDNLPRPHPQGWPRMTDLTIYAEPQQPALPPSDFALDLEHAAVVISDPQIDFIGPEGVAWPVSGGGSRDPDQDRAVSCKPFELGRFPEIGE